MEQYNHFNYGLAFTNSYLPRRKLKLFQPKGEKSFHTAPNSDTLASIDNKLSDINHPVLVAIDGKDSTFQDNEAEVLLKTSQYFYMILMPANDDDPTKILAAQATCEANALQILARMKFDSLKYQEGLTGLLLSSVTIASIGPIGDKLFGVIMGFHIQAGIATKIIDEFWSEVEPES